MRIDHNIKIAKKEVVWKKQHHCGVSFANPYKLNKRGEVVPAEYQKLFIWFYNLDLGQGVSGESLRLDCGWNPKTHSDYFSAFTMNKILTYDKSKRVYVKGENFQAYFDYTQEQYSEVRGK